MTRLHFTNFLENWLSYNFKCVILLKILVLYHNFSKNLTNQGVDWLFCWNRHFKLKIYQFFKENSWNGVVSFVKTLDQSTKGFFIFSEKERNAQDETLRFRRPNRATRCMVLAWHHSKKYYGKDKKICNCSRYYLD